MTKIGLGLPALNVHDVTASSQEAAKHPYDSFSVYGDLGDMPPYNGLFISAQHLGDSSIPSIGPMGISPQVQNTNSIARSAQDLESMLPGRTFVGLVRGAFLESVGNRPASLAEMEEAMLTLRRHFHQYETTPPIYVGGFGERLLRMAGRVGVDGVKLGGTTNLELAKIARYKIGNPEVKLVLGAVSVVDGNRRKARSLARLEVSKYLAVVGELDKTLNKDEQDSLNLFLRLHNSGDALAHVAISDSLLDKFAMAGNPDEVLARIQSMSSVVDRFEFGTPHGLHGRPQAIKYIAETVLCGIEDK